VINTVLASAFTLRRELQQTSGQQEEYWVNGSLHFLDVPVATGMVSAMMMVKPFLMHTFPCMEACSRADAECQIHELSAGLRKWLVGQGVSMGSHPELSMPQQPEKEPKEEPPPPGEPAMLWRTVKDEPRSITSLIPAPRWVLSHIPWAISFLLSFLVVLSFISLECSSPIVCGMQGSKPYMGNLIA